MRDVCSIIKACKDNGVTELKFGELCLKLGGPEKAHEIEAPAAAIPFEDPKAQEKLNEQLRLDAEKDDTALQLILNPFEMERRIANGELIDEASEH